MRRPLLNANLRWFPAAVSLAVFVLAGSPAALMLSALVFSVGVGMIIAAYDSLVARAVPARLRGIAFGLFQTSLGVVSLPTSWLGTQLWARVVPWLPFTVTAGASLLAVVPAYSKLVLPPRVPAGAGEPAVEMAWRAGPGIE